MKTLPAVLAASALAFTPGLTICHAETTGAAPQLVEVASFPTQQVTGIAVSRKSGRIFVNFPYWSDDHPVSVVELRKDGSQAAFPTARWNAADGDPAGRFVCVQSVVIDEEDNLWILDAASPKMEGVVEGGPKLVKVDLQTNAVTQVIRFGNDAAPKKSYLNDVRFDLPHKKAIISESGIGTLLVVDLGTGKTRVLLKDHFSTKAEKTDLVVDGIRPIDPKTGTIPVFHVDGLALDQSAGMLYFHALTGHSLYKISLADLENEQLSDRELGERVAKIGDTPKTDGMLESPDGKIYLAAMEEMSIDRVDPKTGKTETVIQDKHLQWPDTFSWGPDQTIYVTTSQIHRTPQNNKGVSKLQEPYHVYKFQAQ